MPTCTEQTSHYIRNNSHSSTKSCKHWSVSPGKTWFNHFFTSFSQNAVVAWIAVDQLGRNSKPGTTHRTAGGSCDWIHGRNSLKSGIGWSKWLPSITVMLLCVNLIPFYDVCHRDIHTLSCSYVMAQLVMLCLAQIWLLRLLWLYKRFMFHVFWHLFFLLQFGKGVYFADMSSKSANYCFTSRAKNIGLLLLCEVSF